MLFVRFKEVLLVFKKYGLKGGSHFFKFRVLASLNLYPNLSKSLIFQKDIPIQKIYNLGYSILPNIRESDVDKIFEYYKSECYLKFGQKYDSIIAEMYSSGEARGAKCHMNLTSPLKKIIKESKIFEITYRALELSPKDTFFRIYCDTLIRPDNLKKYKSLTIKKNYDDALLFHKDHDALKFLKYFLYLTDCYETSGPHRYIKSSARKAPLKFLGYSRIPSEPIFDYYHKDSLVTFTGPKGFNFIEDTTGFHRGDLPIAGKRVMLSIVFIDKKTFKFSNSKVPHYSQKDLLD